MSLWLPMSLRRFSRKLTPAKEKYLMSKETNFKDAISEFKDSPACTDAFVRLKLNMKILMQEDPENSAVYLIIYEFSRKHHIYYEDQAVSPETSKSAKDQMVGYLNLLEEAYVKHNKKLLFENLSGISYDYFTQGRVLEP